MANFSRKTIIGSLDTFERMGHSEISRFLLEHGLEDVAPPLGSKQKRAASVGAYLLRESGRLDEDGCDLVDVIVEASILRAINTCTSSHGSFRYKKFQRAYPTLHRGLEGDGFTVEDGHLRRALPETLDLPQADDEVHLLLDGYGFTTPQGHLDQAIAAHLRGHWAAANAQLRSFVEGLLDEIAERLNGGAVVPPKGFPRREWLAQIDPPFFIDELNEWKGNGTGFLEGFYRRLHPEGSHPGLADEDDSTFRLHLVLLTSRLLLKRLQQRVPI